MKICQQGLEKLHRDGAIIRRVTRFKKFFGKTDWYKKRAKPLEGRKKYWGRKRIGDHNWVANRS